LEFTHTYETVFPQEVRDRYTLREVRNAGAALAAGSSELLGEVIAVLGGFTLTEAHVLDRGGNKSKAARELDEAFRKLGWREGEFHNKVTTVVKKHPYRAGGERAPTIEQRTAVNRSYATRSTTSKGCVALDGEWNAKDGNLDRDLTAYRAFYQAALIDVGVILTRTQEDLRELAVRLGRDTFKTSTTTNLAKLAPRLARGDAGGCPVLAICISSATMTAPAPSSPENTGEGADRTPRRR